jgi:sigma-B regulation protein RsbU (phosphoserine phosphatase)
MVKERMESELNIGKEIQMHMLPFRFPEQEEIDVYGTLVAAREVGGDWYDCFFIDEDHFCFGIGDVSGKGVPAALFMAVAQTLIKASTPLEKSTANVINLLNKELAVDNPNFMFATIFLCILNIRTGELLFTNAAHNPSYILKAGGEIRAVDSRHGLVVGPLSDSTFEEETITLTAGDTFFMYTDGVTEAMDPAENLFSDQRLADHLSGLGDLSPIEIVQSTMKTVKEFEAGAEQADDITIIAVKFNGSQQQPPGVFAYTISNELSEISDLSQRFEEFCRQENILEAEIPKLHIIFEELLSNIIQYGFAGQQDCSVAVTVEQQGDQLNVTLVDNGIPFNPLEEVKEPDTTLALEERTIGGLGFHIVRKMVDDIRYQRKDDQNILTFSKKISRG